MNKPEPAYEPHLVVKEYSLAPGSEWQPRTSGWSLLQIRSGHGYWLEGSGRAELAAGMVLLIAGETPGRFLTSQLNVVALAGFSVKPDRLAGLITLGEQDFLKQAAARKELAAQIFPPDSALALKMRELLAGKNPGVLSLRLALLQLLVEAFGKELERVAVPPPNTDATERLRAFLRAMPPDTLLEISFDELAQNTNCTARHLSRIFFDVVGMSFRDKRAEIRLARARELLATSESKVVEVAMESGYKSVSLFNLMFTRHFGISPGKWRQKNSSAKTALKKPRITGPRWAAPAGAQRLAL